MILLVDFSSAMEPPYDADGVGLIPLFDDFASALIAVSQQGRSWRRLR
jgi:hypothetical protein